MGCCASTAASGDTAEGSKPRGDVAAAVKEVADPAERNASAGGGGAKQQFDGTPAATKQPAISAASGSTGKATGAAGGGAADMTTPPRAGVLDHTSVTPVADDLALAQATTSGAFEGPGWHHRRSRFSKALLPDHSDLSSPSKRSSQFGSISDSWRLGCAGLVPPTPPAWSLAAMSITPPLPKPNAKQLAEGSCDVRGAMHDVQSVLAAMPAPTFDVLAFGAERPASRPSSAPSQRPTSAAHRNNISQSFDLRNSGVEDDGDDVWATLTAAVTATAAVAPATVQDNADITGSSIEMGDTVGFYTRILGLLRITPKMVMDRRSLLPIIPSIVMATEATRLCDDDDLPDSNAMKSIHEVFAVQVCSDRVLSSRPASQQQLLVQSDRDSQQQSVVTSRVGSAAAFNGRASSGVFVADEEDCRRVLTANQAVREFLESAPRWTTSSSSTPTSPKGRPFGSVAFVGPGAEGRPPRPGRGRQAGVGADDEFLSEARRLMLLAAPQTALALDEARGREDIAVTSFAKAHAARCGCEAVVLFLRHRAALQESLSLHASLLALCLQRTESANRISLYNSWALELGRRLRSAVVRRLLSRLAVEKDNAEAETRRSILRDQIATARQQDALLKKKAWETEKVRLSIGAAKSELHQAKTVVEDCAAHGPREYALRELRNEAAAAGGSDVGCVSLDASRSMAVAGACDGSIDLRSTSAKRLGVSTRQFNALRTVQDFFATERRFRDAVEIESTVAIWGIIDKFSRVLPVGRNGWDSLAARRAAELAAAKMATNRVGQRIEIAIAFENLADAPDPSRTHDPRKLAMEVAQQRVIMNDAFECRDIIEREESAARSALHDASDAAFDLALAHDSRRRTAELLKWRVDETTRRREAASALLMRVTRAAMVRRALHFVNKVRDESRAVCIEAHRHGKQLVQAEVIERADTMQFYLITAPDKSFVGKAVVSPDCVPTVEAAARSVLVRRWADERHDLHTELLHRLSDAALLPRDRVGERQRSARQIQALWRGVKCRAMLHAGLRDSLVLRKMAMLQRRFGVRSLVEAENLRRIRIEDEETAVDLFGKTRQSHCQRVVLRHHAVRKLQAWWRGASWRKFRLSSVQEAYWRRRLKKQKTRGANRSVSAVDV